MPKIINCAVCGQPFRKISRAKYCPNCRDEANRKKKAEAEKRLREERRAENPLPQVSNCDTPEQIQLCLNCTKKNCKGFCRAVREVKSK